MFKKVFIQPVELEYVQFTDENKNQVYDEVASEQMNIHVNYREPGKHCLVIPSFNGEQICHIGDYIIKIPDSKDWCKFMCCSPVVFDRLMRVFGVL